MSSSSSTTRWCSKDPKCRKHDGHRSECGKPHTGKSVQDHWCAGATEAMLRLKWLSNGINGEKMMTGD